MIARDTYLKQLILRKNNGMVKVITGLRRSGKSILLFDIYSEYLQSIGIPERCIIKVALDGDAAIALRDPAKLSKWINGQISDDETYYIFLDEIQYIPYFYGLLNDLNRNSKLDIYVTGSNSRFLSSDVLTEFRGRGDEIRVYPLSFSEFYAHHGGDKREAFQQYYTFGGLPSIAQMEDAVLKMNYLKNLNKEVYIKDILERNSIIFDNELDSLVDYLASSIGSLTNPLRLANTFKSEAKSSITDKTIKYYLEHLVDAFYLEKAKRFDIKGKKYINTPLKYYFTDIGLRNSRLNFREQEIDRMMENIIYNELRIRGFEVDVGVVTISEKNQDGIYKEKNLEVDFVANKGSKRVYIQVAFEVSNPEKVIQEKKSLWKTHDSFQKFIISGVDIARKTDTDGITTISIIDFLLDRDVF